VVNTLRFDGQVCLGDNTDGVGLIRDLRDNLKRTLAGARILVVGAGGAARGVILPLLEGAPRELAIANRTEARAATLAQLFGRAVQASDFAALRGRQFDIVINATSASIAGVAPDLPRGLYAGGALAYDMMYGKGLTPFLLQARDEGALVSDGLGMLVEQAAESFYVWRGVRPTTWPVLDQLRRAA
jgi:shikimate dehydrogenase